MTLYILTLKQGGAKVLITANEAPIGKRPFHLKERIDKALEDPTTIRYVLVAKRTKKDVSMREGRDISLEMVR